ncbi:MAG TPA: phage holin family protein [Thermomicrobiaceae bacterium]|nr:phage holin family protein [Thermomicrobiaceae bacterium]
MVRILAWLVANGLTLWLLARFMPRQVSYNHTWETVIVFAAVLTLLDLILAPILRFITWPLSCLTLGLFSLIVSGAVFYLGGQLAGGIEITYLGALVGGIVAGILSSTLSTALRKR